MTQQIKHPREAWFWYKHNNKADCPKYGVPLWEALSPFTKTLSSREREALIEHVELMGHENYRIKRTKTGLPYIHFSDSKGTIGLKKRYFRAFIYMFIPQKIREKIPEEIPKKYRKKPDQFSPYKKPLDKVLEPLCHNHKDMESLLELVEGTPHLDLFVHSKGEVQKKEIEMFYYALYLHMPEEMQKRLFPQRV